MRSGIQNTDVVVQDIDNLQQILSPSSRKAPLTLCSSSRSSMAWWTVLNFRIESTSRFLLEHALCSPSQGTIILLPMPTTESYLGSCVWETQPSWTSLVKHSSAFGGEFFHVWPGSKNLDLKCFHLINLCPCLIYTCPFYWVFQLVDWLLLAIVPVFVLL